MRGLGWYPKPMPQQNRKRANRAKGAMRRAAKLLTQKKNTTSINPRAGSRGFNPLAGLGVEPQIPAAALNRK